MRGLELELWQKLGLGVLGQELVPRQRLLQLRLWLVLRQGVLQLGL